MAEEKKKTTRVMRVTMDEDEFDKYDRGETHSNSGLRNESGRLSALPDIAPVEDEDLPQREVIVYKDRYPEPEEATVGQRIAEGVANVVVDVLRNPDKQVFEIKQVKLNTTDTQHEMTEIEKSAPTMNSSETFAVNEEQAELIVTEARRKARELLAMIYLLSNLCIKDEKSKEEHIIEQSYIKQLVSDEATNTVKLLTKNG